MSDNQSIIVVAVQMNALVGDVVGNRKKILSFCLRAKKEFNASMVLFPELALTGYPPEDLLYRADLYYQIELAQNEIRKALPKGMTAVIGLPTRKKGKLFNAAWIIGDGLDAYYHKQKLPNYGVFDEKRYFKAGKKSKCIRKKGKKFLITLCEDIWFKSSLKKLKDIDCIININASPYETDKHQQRLSILQKRTGQANAPLIYCNMVGGQDEVVFDGDAMLVDKTGVLVANTPLFEESMLAFEFGANGELKPLQPLLSYDNELKQIYNALVLSVKDYVHKNGFKGVVIGLSGGIDSALTLAIAVDALGADNVEALSMPSRYTAGMSNDDAFEQASKMGVKCRPLGIEPVFKSFLATLKEPFNGLKTEVTEENIQARCRGILVMAMANKYNKMVLTTGNKSEMSMGYCTLYGDMSGGFAPLKDVSKLRVFALSKYRNTVSPVIPQRVITRPPSAELAPNQKDEDSLPPYEILDEILYQFIEKDQSREQIIKQGFDTDVVNKVIRLTLLNEYKRRQSAPGPKITGKAFGRERRFPITSGYTSG